MWFKKRKKKKEQGMKWWVGRWDKDIKGQVPVVQYLSMGVMLKSIWRVQSSKPESHTQPQNQLNVRECKHICGHTASQKFTPKRFFLMRILDAWATKMSKEAEGTGNRKSRGERQPVSPGGRLIGIFRLESVHQASKHPVQMVKDSRRHFFRTISW